MPKSCNVVGVTLGAELTALVSEILPWTSVETEVDDNLGIVGTILSEVLILTSEV